MTTDQNREACVVPSLWKIERCTQHEDYIADCLRCQEEVLTSKTESAYRSGWQAARQAATPAPEPQGVLANVTTPFVCDACRPTKTNWYGPCPHAPKTLNSMLAASPATVAGAQKLVSLDDLLAVKRDRDAAYAELESLKIQWNALQDREHERFVAQTADDSRLTTLLTGLRGLEQLVEKYEHIAEHGEGTPMTDSFQFRCAMERCAAELEAALDTLVRTVEGK